ncbi:MAG: PGF-pre-PGF domain-containing protein [Candidatus Aenigmatarchaeota archaeon]
MEHIFLRNANSGTWNIYVNGTGVSGAQKYFIASDARIFSDAYSPQWSANVSTPNSSANYIKNGNYSFNITWTDDVSVDEVVFEWNFTSNYSYKNKTVTNYGSVFAANMADLAAGNYSFRWLANDTSGKWNSSDSWNYSVERAAPNVTILLNSLAGNLTIASGDFVNIMATSAGEGNISLYNSSALINNTLPPVYNTTSYTGTAGTVFNITAFYNRTQNFTSQTAARFITIDNASPSYSNNKTSPNSSAPYGMNYQFNITWNDETNISSVILEWNDTVNITNYTVPTFSGSGSYNSTKEYYYILSNLSVGNYTYRWLANDSMNNWNSSQNFSYSIVQAASLSRLFMNSTEGNRTYTSGQIVNITASTNVTGKNITIFANFSGAYQTIARATGSVENYTNTSNLNASSVYNITSQFFGDDNYTTSSATYYLGICPASCPAAGGWSSCSGSSQSRITYGCSAATNYACQASTETQSCSSGSSSSGSGGGSSSGVSTNALATAAAEPVVKVSSTGESTTVSISSVQANSQQNINITNSSLPIKEITFFPSEASTNAKVEMRAASAPSTQKPEGEVFQYFSIEKTNVSLGNNTVIEFFADKKWVSDGGINVSTVALNRLSGNWTKLPTSKTGEDSEKFYFRSDTPGFSYFAITGEKTATRQPQANETGGSQAKADAGENEKTGSTAPVFIGALVIIIIICFLIYVSRKKKIKEGRDENK